MSPSCRRRWIKSRLIQKAKVVTSVYRRVRIKSNSIQNAMVVICMQKKESENLV